MQVKITVHLVHPEDSSVVTYICRNALKSCRKLGKLRLQRKKAPPFYKESPVRVLAFIIIIIIIIIITRSYIAYHTIGFYAVNKVKKSTRLDHTRKLFLKKSFIKLSIKRRFSRAFKTG